MKVVFEILNEIKKNKVLLFFLILLSVFFIYQAGIRFGEFIYFITK